MEAHKQKANKATVKYPQDTMINDPKIKVMVVDLQKVLLLPELPGNKESIFTSRLLVFNETFADMSVIHSGAHPSYCIMWHEGLRGREAETIVVAVFSVFCHEREIEDFIFWMDNCTSQNKNWVMYSSLNRICNQFCGPQSITLRYLTKGHTHNAADSIHGNIEKRIRKEKELYDYDHLVKCV